MEIQVFKIEELNKSEYNPRTITQEQLEMLAKSISEYGYVEPIIINKDKTIIGGHQRYDALKMLGEKEVKCVVVDLDKKKEKALNIALNKISGEWNLPILKDILSELKVDDFDMSLTGFSDIEIDNMFNVKQTAKRENGSEEIDDGMGIIQYNIIFDDEEQQNNWYELLKYLKEKYPECETIAERINLLVGEVLNGSEE